MDGNVVYVSWDPPYTGSMYHVTDYNITVALANGTSTSHLLSNSTLSYNYTVNDPLTECTDITFSLYALNLVGTSSPGYVTKTLPAGIYYVDYTSYSYIFSHFFLSN